MHKEQQQHLKTNNIISKLAVIVLSIVLLIGIKLQPNKSEVLFDVRRQTVNNNKLFVYLNFIRYASSSQRNQLQTQFCDLI